MTEVNVIFNLTPIVEIQFNAVYNEVEQVFVMEDGTTRFEDETSNNNFIPE